MLRRVLNVASIVCLVACVAMLGMWVRSHSWHDQIVAGETPAGWQIDSMSGHFQIERMLPSPSPYWEFNSVPIRAGDRSDSPLFPDITLSSYPDYLDVGSPYWFAVLVTATVGILAALPWFHWRFSLRMLFIATTLVAAPLGALTYVLKHFFVTHSY